MGREGVAVHRFRAALLALGLVLVASAAGTGILAERGRGLLDHDLKLAGASRVTARALSA